MEKIEKYIGYFGQMSLPLFIKSMKYCFFFAILAFLQGAYPMLPTDIFSSTKEVWISVFQSGVLEIWEQLLLVVGPLLMSAVNTAKK